MFPELAPARSHNLLDVVVESIGMKKSLKTPANGGEASPIKTPAKGGEFGLVPIIQEGKKCNDALVGRVD